MKKNIAIVIICAIVLSGAGLVLRFWLGSKPAVTYRTVKVARGAISSSVTSTGTINPLVTVTVGSQVSGMIKELYVDYNSRVRKNQPIAQIDPALYKAQVEQSRGAYLAAVANLEKARVTRMDSHRTYRRYQALVKDGSVSVSDFDTSETTFNSSKAAESAAEAAVVQAKGNYDQAKTNLDYTTIRSPVDGIVISRNVDVGQTVAASFQTPTLFSIAQDLTKMQINASVDEADIGKIQEGGPASFTVDAYPDEHFTGIITQSRNAAVTQSNVVTYVVVIDVDNKDLRLRPGMTANVTFTVAHKDDALKLSNAALRFRPTEGTHASSSGQSGQSGQKASAALAPGEKRVYTLDAKGQPKALRIRTGIGNDREIEVTSDNLPEGAEVIVEQVGGKKQTSSGMGMGPGPRF